VNSLPFNLPVRLYPRVLDISSTLNMIPTARSRPHTPGVITTGQKISRKLDLKVPFGACVVVAELDRTVTDLKPSLGSADPSL
jgi:hypothetical protein